MHLKHLALSALAGAVAAQNTTQDLNATLSGNANLSSLTTFLSQFPDLLTTLAGASDITILAPSNEAFTKLLASPAGMSLTSDMGLAQALLQYHVLNGTFYAANITNTTAFVPTLLTNETYTNVTGGQRVAAAVVDNNVQIFSALLQSANVTQADVNFTGGVVHVIDSVLALPMSISETAVAANLTSLVGALNATDLVETVEGLSDVTVFAPANSAFQAIGSALGNLSTDDLSGILSYHVVQGTVGYSTDLANGTSLTTINGANLTVYVENGTVFVNSAKVVTANVLVANGVVHVIDNVLNPNNTSAEPSGGVTTGVPAFPSASSGSAAPFTSGVPTPKTTIASSAGPPAAGATSSSTAGAALPMNTGLMGPAMLFGGAAMVMINL